MSMRESSVPNGLKIAKVIPLFKSGVRSSLENYRPISVLSTVSKILERVIYNQNNIGILHSITSETQPRPIAKNATPRPSVRIELTTPRI